MSAHDLERGRVALAHAPERSGCIRPSLDFRARPPLEKKHRRMYVVVSAQASHAFVCAAGPAMAASSGSGPPRYSWEQAGSQWKYRPPGGESDDENSNASDDEEPTAVQAGAIFVEFLLNLLYTNALSAKAMCILCYWAAKAGAAGPVTDFALKPGSPSGHYRRKVDAATNVDLRASEASMYKISVPQHSKYDLSRTLHPMPVRLPHEELAEEVLANPACLQGPICETAAYKSHPVVRANPGVPVMPVALYLDGIAFTKRDSMLGIFVYSLITMKRHLCMVLRRSHLCKCGCKGFCSLFPVFEALRYSFTTMASGTWPSQRHNGAWTADDSGRAAKAGRPLGFFAALLQIRGDWSEFAHTLGLADWGSRLFCCMFCKATRETRFDVSGFNPLSDPWGVVSHTDMDQACQACEHWRTLSPSDHAQVKALLRFDKGRAGGGGLCLMADMPGLALMKGDRVEPHSGMQDVAEVLRIGVFPARVLFWRKSADTRCRRRNPMLMAPDIGITVDSLMVDKLHTLNLGPALFWCSHSLWRLILTDSWGTGMTGEQLHHASVMQIRNALWEWYRDQRRIRPHEEITQVTDFTVRMLGKPGSQSLSTKAAETKGLVPFVLSLLKKYRTALTVEESGALIGAGDALQEVFEIMARSPRELPPRMVQRFYDATKKHLVLSAQAGMVLKPKHHMLLHMASRAQMYGNPDHYSTFEDESINKLLKKVGEAAHRSVWETRVLVQFGKVEDTRVGSKRRAPE